MRVLTGSLVAFLVVVGGLRFWCVLGLWALEFSVAGFEFGVWPLGESEGHEWGQ